MEHKSKKKIRVKPLGWLLLLFLLGGVAFGVWKYTSPKPVKSLTIPANQNPYIPQQELVRRVAAIYNVPKDETPQVVQVPSADNIKGQPFFKDAQTGDVVLIYNNAKLAILYRPSQNQIINIGPISFPDQNQSASTSSSVTLTPQVSSTTAPVTSVPNNK